MSNYLLGLLYPHRHLQERFYSILPFLAKHGTQVVEPIYRGDSHGLSGPPGSHFSKQCQCESIP